MPKYRVYGSIGATVFLGEYEAESKEEAQDMGADSDKCYVSLCYQCAREIDIGDVYEITAEALI